MQYIRFSICYKVILICAIFKGIHGNTNNVISLVKQYAVINETVVSNNVTQLRENLDFIHKIQFILKEEKIIPYVKEEVYQNYEKHNITTEDLIELWKLRDYNLKELTKLMDIPEVFLDLTSFRLILGAANLTFNQYYETIRKNISNNQLKEILDILNLNQAKFASNIAFGTENEIYEVLNEGVYTWDKFEEINNKTGIDIATVSRNLILDQFSMKNVQSVLADMQKLPLINKNIYDKAWNEMVNSTQDIFKVVNIRKIVDNIHENLTANVILGVAINEHEIILHKKTLNNLEKLFDIIQVYSESVLTHQILDNSTLMIMGTLRNTSSLYCNTSLIDKIDIMDSIENETIWNCTYIDKDIIERNVTVMNITMYNVEVTVDDGVIFNLGNPLICDEKLVGLAVIDRTSENIITFDTFFKMADQPNSSSRKRQSQFLGMLLILAAYNLFKIC